MKTTFSTITSFLRVCLSLLALAASPWIACAQPCAAPPAGLVSWWPAEGTANDLANTNHGELVGGVSFGSGKVGQAFSVSGGSFVRVPKSASLDVGLGGGFTIEAWINPTDVANGHVIAEWNRGVGDPVPGVAFWLGHPSLPPGVLIATIANAASQWQTVQSPGGVVLPNVMQHVAMTFDKATLTVRLFVNGAQVAQGQVTITTPQTSHDLCIGHRPLSSYSFAGLIDEVGLYGRALSQTELQSVFNAGSAGKCTTPQPPGIVGQPQSQTVTAGASVLFGVTANGTAPLHYQWLFNGAPLTDATNGTVTLVNVQLSQAGNYSVVVSNAAGTTNSAGAVLTVNALPPCAAPPAGLVSWWPAEGTANDVSGANHGTLSGGAYAPGKVGLAFSLPGGTNQVRVPASPSLNVGLGGGFTVEAWVYLTNVSGSHPLFEWNQPAAGVPYGVHLWVARPTSPAGEFIANLIDTASAEHVIASPAGLITPNVFHHVALSYDKASGMARLFHNGALVQSVNLGSFTPQTSYDLYWGRRPAGQSAGALSGLIDEPSLYNRALATAEILAIYNAGVAGKCQTPTAPTILTAPQSQTVIAGDSANFSVLATGTAPLSYQWRHEGTNLPGATASTLVLANAQLADAGAYSVEVTNSVGSATSSNAVLTVNPPPPCAPVPSGLVSWWAAEGNAADQVGANHGTLSGGATIAPGKVGQAWQFAVSGDFVRVPASSSLDVGAAPGFTVEGWINPTDTGPAGHPMVEWSRPGRLGLHWWLGKAGFAPGYMYANVVDVNGGYHVIEALGAVRVGVWQHLAVSYDKASGLARLYVDGQVVREQNLGTFTPLTQDDLRVGGTTYGSGYAFPGKFDELSLYNRAVTSAEVLAIYSAAKTGKCPVLVAPTLATQPQGQTVTVGGTATFSVVAGGTVPLSYQWRLNGAALAGATGASLVLSNVQFAHAGNYTVVVTNIAGSVTSSPAALTVNFPAAVVRVGSASTTAGSSVEVPVTLVANGNENALGFSLNFNPALLTYEGVTLGGGASGASLFFNTVSLASGKLGLLVGLPSGTTFAPGTQEVVRVTFTTAIVITPTLTGISFGDQPTARQLSDAAASLVVPPPVYLNGIVTVAAADFEGDVSPRPNGDKAVTVTDWVLVGLYAARLDSPTNATEFQRADCAPRNKLGDGKIKVTDWVQAGRYAVGSDPLTPVGGPTSEGHSFASSFAAGQAFGGGSARVIRVADAVLAQDQTNALSVILAAQGNENALGFSLTFDPAMFGFLGATLGTGAGGATLTVNTNQAGSGLLGVVMALPFGGSFAAGSKEVLRVNLRTSSTTTGTYPAALTDDLVPREISDAAANSLDAGYVSGTIAVNGPAPALRIARSGQDISLLWPQWATNYALQVATPRLPPAGTWTNLNAAASVMNNENVVTVTNSGGAGFYRLFRP